METAIWVAWTTTAVAFFFLLLSFTSHGTGLFGFGMMTSMGWSVVFAALIGFSPGLLHRIRRHFRSAR